MLLDLSVLFSALVVCSCVVVVSLFFTAVLDVMDKEGKGSQQVSHHGFHALLKSSVASLEQVLLAGLVVVN